jgi:four helix bundle protein
MFPYEQLEVYKKAFHLNEQFYQLLKANHSFAPYIKNQLGRASLSIMLNIAEGSAKSSNRDRKNFFMTARGSVFECTSIVCFLHAQAEIPDNLKHQLYCSLEEISKILYTMIKNLGA